MYIFLMIPNVLFGIEKSFLAGMGQDLVINSLGNGGSTLLGSSAFLWSRSMEKEEEGW